MTQTLRSRARWSFAGIGIAFVLALVLGLLIGFRIVPPNTQALGVILGLAMISCYFSGVSAMLRLKGVVAWKGVLLAVFLLIASSIVRALYRPAQPVAWLLLTAFPVYLATRPDVPEESNKQEASPFL